MLKLLVLSVIIGATNTAQAEVVQKVCPGHLQGVNYYRTATWEWQKKHGAHKIRSVFSDRTSKSCDYVVWVADLWRNRAKTAREKYHKALAERRRIFQALYRKYKCIHLHEAAWNDPNPPYYGGLQMDLQFQRTYGSEFLRRWGTADKWPVAIQLMVAERAYDGYGGYGARYFGPWPTWKAYCS